MAQGRLLADVPAIAFLTLAKMVLTSGGAGHADHVRVADNANLEADSADRQPHADLEQQAAPRGTPLLFTGAVALLGGVVLFLTASPSH